MARYFNIGGLCTAADNYMLAAAERLPEVMSLVDKKQYFVIHAPRQCGKTTMFLGHGVLSVVGEPITYSCPLVEQAVQRYSQRCASDAA